MRNYRVIRYGMGRNSTLGLFMRVEEDGSETQLCFTLEDERRKTKVMGETCIPTGSFDLVLYKDGSKHKDYGDKYGSRHKGMILVKDVPDFVGVLIHILNYENQTDGCVGVGLVPAIAPDGEFYILRSTDAYWKVYEEIVPLLIAGERVVLHVTEIQPWA